jgi:hypothetical protein
MRTSHERRMRGRGCQLLVQPVSSASGQPRGYSNIRNSFLFDIGLFASLLTIALAIFGRGTARILLAGSGFLLVIVACGALLSNGV